MSSELLLNFDKSDTKKLGSSNSQNLGKTDSNNKKEGLSLFDSLLSEAKQEVPTKEVSKETTPSDNNTTKNQQSHSSSGKKVDSKETTNVSSNSNSTTQSSTENTPKENNIKENSTTAQQEGKTETIKSNVSTSTQDISEVDDKTLKKVVDKLVDIIVSSAKDLKNATGSKNSLQSEVVKDKINQLLENKLQGSSKIGELQSEVNKIINTSGNQGIELETIKSEVTKALEGKSLDNLQSQMLNQSEEKLTLVKQSVEIITSVNEEIKEVLGSQTKVDKLDSQKQTIQDETSLIKKNINELQLVIDNPELSDEKVTKEVDKLNKTIETNVNKIENSLDNIESAVSKIELTTEQSTVKIKVDENIKQIPQKIEYEIESIKQNVNEVEENVSKIIIVKTTGDLESLKEENQNTNLMQKDVNTKENKDSILSNMFLQSQRTTKETTSLEQLKDVKDSILNQKTLEAVKEGAKKLNLEVESTEVEHECDETQKSLVTENKNSELKNQNQQNRFLNQALMNEKLDESNKNIDTLRVALHEKELLKSTDTDNTQQKKTKADIIELNVPKDIVQTLQSKIIGAQQKMGSFMSDVARNMYLNYKPPVTAFRINLNPANLGSIAVVMKANKMDNSLSVSMNLSNSNTLDAFTENKALLQNAIQRQFNENSNVSIDFGMQTQDSENAFSQFNQNNGENNQEQSNSSDDSSNQVKEEQEVVTSSEYM